MKKAGIYLYLILLYACNPFDEDPNYESRIIIKEIIIDSNFRIELYHYSLISGYSPSFVEVKSRTDSTVIAESTYINDIFIKEDTLFIQTWKDDNVKVQQKIGDFVTKVDTNGIQKNY